MEADTFHLAGSQIDVPEFRFTWSDALAQGAVQAQLTQVPDVRSQFSLTAPSLRRLLTTVGVPVPPTRDATVLAALQLTARVHYNGTSAQVEALELTLDDTHITGTAALSQLAPLGARFDLTADQVDVDRYLEPANSVSEPFELPLAKLKALDVRGVLKIRSARIAGATAREVRIDVE
jgi:AsmA protein